jgi:hypothetical protein
MQGTCRELAGIMQGTCREHKANMQGTCWEHGARNKVQGTCREQARNMQGTSREQAGNMMQGTGTNHPPDPAASHSGSLRSAIEVILSQLSAMSRVVRQLFATCH